MAGCRRTPPGPPYTLRLAAEPAFTCSAFANVWVEAATSRAQTTTQRQHPKRGNVLQGCTLDSLALMQMPSSPLPRWPARSTAFARPPAHFSSAASHRLCISRAELPSKIVSVNNQKDAAADTPSERSSPRQGSVCQCGQDPGCRCCPLRALLPA